jgi:two-component system, NarL family, nitrate/nitrite response regulator NarL
MDSKRAGSAKTASRGEKPAGKRRKTVVIADDDPTLLDQIGSILETRFDVVGRARNGRELLTAVQKLSPSVAVTDITMPEMNGIEAARLIAKNCPGVKVVVLSVHDDPAIVEAAFEAGASGYVSKFTAFVELIPAIENALVGRLYRSSDLR